MSFTAIALSNEMIFFCVLISLIMAGFVIYKGEDKKDASK